MEKTLFDILTIKGDDAHKELSKQYCRFIERIIPRCVSDRIQQINAYYGGIPKYKALINAGYVEDIAAVHAISYAILYMANISQKEECLEVLDILYPNNAITLTTCLRNDNAKVNKE